MREQAYDDFDRPGWSVGRRAMLLPYGLGVLLLLAILYFLYLQMVSVQGIRIEAPSPRIVEMLPPPPPPPPPPPEVKKPPEPTEKPEPAPSSDQPKAQQPTPAPAPMTMNAPAQAGEGAIAAGSGAGFGAPSSTGTCLANCGSGDGGTGMSEAVYRRYLSSALQQRVQEDDKLSRFVFSADFTLTVTRDGRIAGVQLSHASGRNDRDTMQRLAAVLEEVRGLEPPPATMMFPQKVTVRGKRAL